MGQFKQLRNNNTVETVTKKRISITETITVLEQDFTPADNSLFNAKVLYGIFKTNNLFLNRKCQKMFLKSHFQFFQSREL